MVIPSAHDPVDSPLNVVLEAYPRYYRPLVLNGVFSRITFLSFQWSAPFKNKPYAHMALLYINPGRPHPSEIYRQKCHGIYQYWPCLPFEHMNPPSFSCESTMTQQARQRAQSITP